MTGKYIYVHTSFFQSNMTIKLIMLTFQVYMMVDYGSFDRTRSFAGRFSNLKSKILFVGGANRLDNLPGTKATQNFHGCLRGVSFTIHGSIILND